MPHVTGTASLSPRRRIKGRVTPSRLARRWVSDNHIPSSTRAPSRASWPTLHVPIASRSRTTTAPANQIVASSGIMLAPVGELLDVDVVEMLGLLIRPDAEPL